MLCSFVVFDCFVKDTFFMGIGALSQKLFYLPPHYIIHFDVVVFMLNAEVFFGSTLLHLNVLIDVEILANLCFIT